MSDDLTPPHWGAPEPDEFVIPTKERLGTYDAIETAKPDEPLFPVQGGDPFGPPTVLHWAKLCREAGTLEEDKGKRAHLLTKASQAEDVAWAMQAYQKGEAQAPVEVPMPTEAQPDDKPLSEAQLSTRAALIRGASTAHHATALVRGLADTLGDLQVLPAQRSELSRIGDCLARLAGEIEPRRGNERS